MPRGYSEGARSGRKSTDREDGIRGARRGHSERAPSQDDRQITQKKTAWSGESTRTLIFGASHQEQGAQLSKTLVAKRAGGAVVIETDFGSKRRLVETRTLEADGSLKMLFELTTPRQSVTFTRHLVPGAPPPRAEPVVKDETPGG